jgi:hypothetical protein
MNKSYQTPEERSAYHTKYYQDNIEHLRKQKRRHAANPRAKLRKYFTAGDRVARKRTQTPKWANTGYIRLFYEGAKIQEKLIGKKVHVDHIIPLQHDLVCGLHCEDNLQWLTEEANLAKSNTFEIE